MRTVFRKIETNNVALGEDFSNDLSRFKIDNIQGPGILTVNQNQLPAIRRKASMAVLTAEHQQVFGIEKLLFSIGNVILNAEFCVSRFVKNHKLVFVAASKPLAVR